MWRVAETQLRCGLSCLVDCPLARRTLFDRAAALAAQYGARLALVELQPGDAEVWRRRVEQRGAADAGTEHAHKPGSWSDIQTVLQRTLAARGGVQTWNSSRATSPTEIEPLDRVTPEQLAQVAAEVAAEVAAASCTLPAEAATPPSKGPSPARLSLEDSAGPRLGAKAAADAAGETGAPFGGAACAERLRGAAPAGPAASQQSFHTASAAGTLASPLGTPCGGASPAHTPSCGPSPYAGPSAAASRQLSRQSSFSQPYFAEFEGEAEAVLRHQRASEQSSGGGAHGSGAVTPRAAPARCTTDNSGSLRAAQLLEAQDQMTMEELHDVSASFNHVFVPPWAVPAPPPAPLVETVRSYREAAVQAGGTGGDPPSRRSSHTGEDMADHYEAFMQHFGASLPHLAMALADLHLARGGGDPLFVKSQYFFNTLLQMKDEMFQLGERLVEPRPRERLLE
ncbi:hypothetical protein C2E20_0200 [Micractinium conductrix]|uniref:Uncharacterized protein n=1 Tax=Micractinium conductrix TaxID=554055 RepID=A0A2P6VPK4_9CHLO|nr:hypothetical protein C2E20_0200 [Micractinium conductrix]|eukprot:PSC76026.1 hypothetical protein C2E20_0200 [Micractinium conductrix]